MMGPSTALRPWFDDRESVADLIEWLHYRAPVHHGPDCFELFRVRTVSDVIDVMRAPGRFSREWAAYQEWKVRKLVEAQS